MRALRPGDMVIVIHAGAVVGIIRFEGGENVKPRLTHIPPGYIGEVIEPCYNLRCATLGQMHGEALQARYHIRFRSDPMAAHCFVHTALKLIEGDPDAVATKTEEALPAETYPDDIEEPA